MMQILRVLLKWRVWLLKGHMVTVTRYMYMYIILRDIKIANLHFLNPLLCLSKTNHMVVTHSAYSLSDNCINSKSPLFLRLCVV